MTTSSEAQPVTPAPPERRSRKTVMILGGSLAAALVVILVLLLAPSGGDAAVSPTGTPQAAPQATRSAGTVGISGEEGVCSEKTTIAMNEKVHAEGTAIADDDGEFRGEVNGTITQAVIDPISNGNVSIASWDAVVTITVSDYSATLTPADATTWTDTTGWRLSALNDQTGYAPATIVASEDGKTLTISQTVRNSGGTAPSNPFAVQMGSSIHFDENYVSARRFNSGIIYMKPMTVPVPPKP